jgi:hypothetical protein
MGTEPQLTMTRRTASGMDVPRGRTRVSFEAVAHLAELADFNVAFALRAVCQLRVADLAAERPGRPIGGSSLKERSGEPGWPGSPYGWRGAG